MNIPNGDRDDRVLLLLAQAVFMVEREVSISLMQRRLKLGYSRALKIMDQLELAGVVTALNAENVRTLTAAYERPTLDADSIDE